MTYDKAREILNKAGYHTDTQVTMTNSVIVGLEVPVSPILMDEAVESIKNLLPSFLVDGMKNEQYVLIRKNL